MTLEQIGVNLTAIEAHQTGRTNQIVNSKYMNNCSPIASSEMDKSNDGRCCQICKFEGRGIKLSCVNFCIKHKVRCCSISHDDHTDTNTFRNRKQKISCTDWSWMCPHVTWTCWRKFHEYYLPAGLFHNVKERCDPFSSVQFNRRNTMFKCQQDAINVKNSKFIGEYCPENKSHPNSNNQIIMGRKTIQDELRKEHKRETYKTILEDEAKKNKQKKKDMEKEEIDSAFSKFHDENKLFQIIEK